MNQFFICCDPDLPEEKLNSLDEAIKQLSSFNTTPSGVVHHVLRHTKCLWVMDTPESMEYVHHHLEQVMMHDETWLIAEVSAYVLHEEVGATFSPEDVLKK